MQDEKYRKTKRGCRTAHCAAAPGSAQVLVAAADDLLYRKQFHGGPPCPCDAGFIVTKGRVEKQGEHFCLHFLRGCAILLYTDECISPHAIVAQLDRAFGSDPEGQRFESSRSHQEQHLMGCCSFCFARILWGGKRRASNSPCPALCVLRGRNAPVGRF